MKLWILRPIENLPKGDNPWVPWYDKAFGFVVRAETEENARTFAHKNGGDENREALLGGKAAGIKSPWLSAKYSTCDELPTEGTARVVLRNFRAA